MATINEMLPDVNKYIRSKALQLLTSGGVNLESYENDYQLPKIIITVALDSIISFYMPLSSEGKKEVANLKHF